MKLIDSKIKLCSILMSEGDFKVFMNTPEAVGGIQMIENTSSISKIKRVDELSTINELLVISEI